MLENPISSTTVGVQWEPTWLVDCGNDCKVGITMDDGCYLVLVQDQKAPCDAGRQRQNKVGKDTVSGAAALSRARIVEDAPMLTPERTP